MARVNRWICEHLSDSSMWQKGITLWGILAENGKSPIESGYTICLLCLLIYFREISFLFFYGILSHSCLFHMTKYNRIRFGRIRWWWKRTNEKHERTQQNKDRNGKCTPDRPAKCVFFRLLLNRLRLNGIQVIWNLNTVHAVSKLYARKKKNEGKWVH